ncbi:MAG: tetratricopeptide repeat protein [Pseudohongiellaceae bacterium]
MSELTALQALQRGIAAHKQGNTLIAEKYYRAILKSRPNHPNNLQDRDVLAEAYTNLGVALQQRGEVDAAIDNYQQAVKLKPDYTQVYYTMGLALRNKGALKASIDCYQQAVNNTPNDVDSLNNLGAALQHSGEIDSAIDCYEQALKIDPACSEVYNNMGVALQVKGDLAAAIGSFTQALKIKPNYVNAHNNMGHALHDRGDLQAAIDCYNNALKLAPESAETLNNLGNALRKRGDYEEAIKHFDSITTTESNPSNAQFWFNSKAQALECLYISGRYDELEERIKALAESGDINLRIAAVSAFISHQLKIADPYPFCKKPLDFLHIGNLNDHVSEVDGFIEALIVEAKRENQVWEPIHGVTKGGYQTPNTIFTAGENCAALEKLLRTEIDSYYAKFQTEDCAYIKSWPDKYDLRGWFARLTKDGHQTPHNHPSGWLSGVVYLKTIDSPDTDDGAIELGLHGHNLTILDEGFSRKTHRPKKGDIVLFPSSLFHHTIPFRADTDRCVIAFDLYRY